MSEQEPQDEQPAFQGLDADRLKVAEERAVIERLLDLAKTQVHELKSQADRLAARDERNGYVEMWRQVIGRDSSSSWS